MENKFKNLKIEITKTTAPKAKPTDVSKLGFGKIFTDHMFIGNYDEGKGWHSGKIVPYAPLTLDPSAMCLHYGQEVFEGMKAYRSSTGEVLLFRPDKNMERLNLSNARLCIPAFDEDYMVEAIRALVDLDKEWIPEGEDTSLYIRPFIIAVDADLSVHSAHSYIFMVIMSPVGPYYAEGVNPVKIYVETEYVRAVKGGTGYAKTGGNYAASLKAQEKAEERGYSQVLWLDGVDRKYIEEVGTMNVFFKIDGEIITPELSGSVLGGITRMSCIELLRSWGYTVREERLAIETIRKAAQAGTLEEAFGTGTAAVISPIGELAIDGEAIEIGGGETGEVACRLYNSLRDIQTGEAPDEFGWVVRV